MPGKKFPDLTGDGKVTRKDILKGRGVEGFEKGGKVDLDKLPRSMKKKTRTGLFSSEFTDVKETKKPRTKAQKEAVQSEMDELRAKGAMSFPRPDSVSVEERARANKLVRQENRRSRSERKTQQEMGSFKEGGEVDAMKEHMEAVSKKLGEAKQGDIQAKYPTKGTRSFKGQAQPSRLTKNDKEKLAKRRPPRDPGADDRMKEFERSAREAGFADGGMVRGCKGVQVSG